MITSLIRRHLETKFRPILDRINEFAETPLNFDDILEQIPFIIEEGNTNCNAWVWLIGRALVTEDREAGKATLATWRFFGDLLAVGLTPQGEPFYVGKSSASVKDLQQAASYLKLQGTLQ